jgi:hypothetical protein
MDINYEKICSRALTEAFIGEEDAYQKGCEYAKVSSCEEFKKKPDDRWIECEKGCALKDICRDYRVGAE